VIEGSGGAGNENDRDEFKDIKKEIFFYADEHD